MTTSPVVPGEETEDGDIPGRPPVSREGEAGALQPGDVRRGSLPDVRSPALGGDHGDGSGEIDDGDIYYLLVLLMFLKVMTNSTWWDINSYTTVSSEL